MDFDYKLLAKYLTENLTSEELSQIMQWREESEQNKGLFATLMGFKIANQFNTTANIDAALLVLNKRINKRKIHFRLPLISKYAAIFLLLIALSYTGWRYMINQESYISIIVNDKEDVKRVDLADGTVVWLNGASTLQIPKRFTVNNRFVKLDGEAFFDVVKNAKSPFTVLTDKDISLKVLGTSFNLKADSENETVETTLVSGKVSLLDVNQQTIYTMSPSEKVIFQPKLNKYSIETVDTNISTAWHLNQMTFENSSLRDIVNKLSMIYSVNINLESKKLADRKYRCVINKDESLEDVLAILKYLAPIKYKIEENEVFIYE